MNAEGLFKSQRLSSDIISTLPQTILEIILCLLPIEDAARTSILAREWRYKWTKIPKLAFYWNFVPERTTKREQSPDMISARKSMDRRCKLFYAIQQVLLLHQGPIHEFTLYTDSGHHTSLVDQIILHLSSNHSLKKLTLGFCGDEFQLYKLPFCVFSLRQLTDLTLMCVNLDRIPILSGFDSLKSLDLYGVAINTKALLCLLSNCPSLTSFTLIDDERDIGHKDCTIIELFECLPMIEDLTLTGEVVQTRLVLDSVPEELPTSLIHLKYFQFEEMCYNDDHGFVFLAVLIKCSPNLEKITLEPYDMADRCCEDGIPSAILAKYTDVWLEHLIELEIKWFYNYKPEMEFVKFILTRSPKLKKVSINTDVSDKEIVEMLKVLLRAPRASAVEIVVD